MYALKAYGGSSDESDDSRSVERSKRSSRQKHRSNRKRSKKRHHDRSHRSKRSESKSRSHSSSRCSDRHHCRSKRSDRRPRSRHSDRRHQRRLKSRSRSNSRRSDRKHRSPYSHHRRSSPSERRRYRDRHHSDRSSRSQSLEYNGRYATNADTYRRIKCDRERGTHNHGEVSKSCGEFGIKNENDPSDIPCRSHEMVLENDNACQQAMRQRSLPSLWRPGQTKPNLQNLLNLIHAEFVRRNARESNSYVRQMPSASHTTNPCGMDIQFPDPSYESQSPDCFSSAMVTNPCRSVRAPQLLNINSDSRIENGNDSWKSQKVEPKIEKVEPQIEINDESPFRSDDIISADNADYSNEPITSETLTGDSNQLQLKSQIRNFDPECHSLSKDLQCKICKKCYESHAGLIKHFVNVHPYDEVFPSRVRPDIGELLRDPKVVHKCGRVEAARHVKHRQFCYFCNMILSLEKNLWRSHLASHTGYFQYQCTDCFNLFSSKTSHACMGVCNVQMVSQGEFDKQFEGTSVTGYLCDLCNYVRFDRTEMKSHLKNEHGSDDSKEFKAVTFLRFAESPTSARSAVKTNALKDKPKATIISPVANAVEDVSIIIKNIDPNWHCQNGNNICKICGIKMRFAVSHYVNSHPTNEVIPSRISPISAEIVRRPSYAPQYDVHGRYFKQFCVFCEELKSMRKNEWITHIIGHTGYYRYQCDCCLKKFTKPNGHTCKWVHQVKIIQQPRIEGVNAIVAYLCDLCNFVRFDKTEMEGHLRNEHERNSDVINEFKEFIILSFIDPISECQLKSPDAAETLYDYDEAVTPEQQLMKDEIIIDELENVPSASYEWGCMLSPTPSMTLVSDSDADDGWNESSDRIN